MKKNNEGLIEVLTP